MVPISVAARNTPTVAGARLVPCLRLTKPEWAKSYRGRRSSEEGLVYGIESAMPE